MIKNFMMYWIYNHKTIGYVFVFMIYMTYRIFYIKNIR